MITVLIVNSHTILRHGLRLILQEDPALSVVGEAANGSEAVHQTHTFQPDVVLMDLALPDTCGIDTIAQIRASSADSEVLILTTSDRDEDMVAACKAGAKGYLLNNVTGKDVIQAIHQVAAGQATLSPPVTNCILNELSSPSLPPEALTSRELDVLNCLTLGLGNKEIATMLSISQNTVKTHVRRILAKLNLRNRTEAATYAMQANLFPDNQSAL